MLKISDVTEWRAYANDLRAKGHTIGLVPTMGALHQGHVALVHEAKLRGDVVLMTIFVNPRQFNDSADLEKYPRTPEHDLAVALESGVDCLIEPTLESMWPDYPQATKTTVSVAGLGDTLEGAGRPGHFDGVASVVAKLFAITRPARAYFGEKDFQQLAVIRQMVRDVGFGVDVIGCPIIRDDDGVALSSRNVRLSDEGRVRARSLSRAVKSAGEARGTASQLRTLMNETLAEHNIDVAYAEIVDPRTLVPSRDDESGEKRALIAGIVDGVRLIDNGPVTIGEG